MKTPNVQGFVQSNGETRTDCPSPKCKKPNGNFSINTETWKGICFYCGFTIKGLRQAVDAFGEKDAPTIASFQWRPDTMAVGPLFRQTRDWSRPNEPPEDTADKVLWMELMKAKGCAQDMWPAWDPISRRMWFQLYALEPHLPIGCTGRVLDPNRKPKWFNPPGIERSRYTWFYMVRGARPLVIVEGIFDGIAIAQAGFNAWALLGTSLPIQHASFIHKAQQQGRFEGIWLWLDPDEAGEKATKNITRMLSDWDLTPSSCFQGYPEPSECPDVQNTLKLRLAMLESIKREAVV